MTFFLQKVGIMFTVKFQKSILPIINMRFSSHLVSASNTFPRHQRVEHFRLHYGTTLCLFGLFDFEQGNQILNRNHQTKRRFWRGSATGTRSPSRRCGDY